MVKEKIKGSQRICTASRHYRVGYQLPNIKDHNHSRSEFGVEEWKESKSISAKSESIAIEEIVEKAQSGGNVSGDSNQFSQCKSSIQLVQWIVVVTSELAVVSNAHVVDDNPTLADIDIWKIEKTIHHHQKYKD